MKTIRLTMAQAVVRYLCSQFTELEGARVPLFAGVFGIFGHGNVTCLSEALESVQDRLPTWRGQNEQSMALAAIAFAKAKKRRQFMVAAASIGPGATNMVTAAGMAHANRLPVLLLAGDVFASRTPDPVLQQVEHFGNPTTTVNDAFRAVTRYWDRITHPEQILFSLPQAIAAMLDPGECGPAFLGLCQDVQAKAFDYPEAFFEPALHAVPRPRPDRDALQRAAELLKTARKPLIIAGGGVRYSLAEEAVTAFAQKHGIPIAETVAGKGTISHHHPMHVGPIGIIGSTSANALAGEADVILAIGTRLQDFTTGSWSVFSPGARFIAINAARFDAVKHRALALVGDARESVTELDAAVSSWRSDADWMRKGQSEFARWNRLLDEPCKNRPTIPSRPMPKWSVSSTPRQATATSLITAAGGLPGEVTKNWRVKAPNTFDCEFGFSCMGYEIAGRLGRRHGGRRPATPIVMVGDGTYLMMNSDIYSSVLTGHKMILVSSATTAAIAVINRLQNAKGVPSFNNLIKDSRVKEPFAVDFVRHAESMGALARRVDSLADLGTAIDWAKGNDRTSVICIATDAFDWTPGDAWWDVGVPEVSDKASVREAYETQHSGRAKQRIGV